MRKRVRGAGYRSRLRQPRRRAIVYRPNVVLRGYLETLRGTGLYGQSLTDLVDRFVCEGVERRIAHVARKEP